MKTIITLIRIFINAYSFSADPNFMGSKKRRLAKEDLAYEFLNMAQGTQGEIDQLQTQNPFETAGAKAAMAKASRNARQMQTRMMNAMGNQATPEAQIAATGALNEAAGAEAGQIAVGAEANRNAQLNALKGQKTGQMGAYAGIKTDSIDEIGQGWKDFFANLDGITSIISSVGQVAQLAAGA